MTRTCDKNIYEFRWILTGYEQRTRGKEKKHTDDIRLHLIYKRYSSFSLLFHHGDEGDHQMEA